MTSAASSTNGLAPIHVGDSSAQGFIDAGRAEDVYAAWKSVFEHSRATEPAKQGEQLCGTDADGAPGEQTLRSTSSEEQSAADTVGFQHSARPGGNARASLNRADISKRTVETTARATGQSNRTPQSLCAPVLQRSTSLDKAVAARLGPAALPATLSGTSAQLAPDECVQVLVRGNGVAIVVRDTSLSADEAKQCALRTAQELTGRSDSLQHVTLNGRTIYQQPSHDTQPPAYAAEQGATVLEFAC